jgi:hypothetical protein
LASPGPYLAAGIALACYFPNFLWNAQNGWITYNFQFRRLLQGGEFDFVHPLGVFLAPLLLLSPWVYGLTALVAGRILKRSLEGEDRGMALAFWSSFPMFLFFVYVSMSDSVKIHWTAPAFIGILPAVAATVQEWSSRKRVLFYGSNPLLLFGLLYLVFLAVSHSLPNSWFPTVLGMSGRSHGQGLVFPELRIRPIGEFLKSQIRARQTPISISSPPELTAQQSPPSTREAIAPSFRVRYQRGFTLWKSPYLKPGANALYIERHQSSQRRQNREFQNLRDVSKLLATQVVDALTRTPFRELRVYPATG